MVEVILFMQTTIEDQIRAVQSAKSQLHPKGKYNDQLNDAASTLAAIKMILSGDVGAEFMTYLTSLVDNRTYQETNIGQDLVNFLKQKGLPIK